MTPRSTHRAGRSRLVLAATPLAAVAVLATACSGGGGGGGQAGSGGGTGGSAGAAGATSSSAPASSSSAEAGEAETIKTATVGKLGPILLDESGRTVYLFEKDKSSSSTCYDQCANAWPPVTTSAKPQAMGRAKSGKLGTTKRKNGKMQVTYAGHPLYYYAPDDHQAKSHKGEGLKQFGAEWYVLSPQGKKVEKGGSGGGGY